jgi:SPP1 family predicted phage head-tail adaptor
MPQMSNEIKNKLSVILNERIKILKVEEKRIDGKPIKTDLEFHSCRAKALDLIGNELYQAINIKFKNTIIFQIRYSKKLEALRNKKEEYKVIWNDEIYSIYNVDYLGNKKDFIKIKCNQVK